MASVSLSVPVLIQNINIDGQWQYYIRPVFFQYPVATHRRYESAIQNFRAELRDYFRGFRLERQNLNNLLWYTFNPSVVHLKPRYHFLIGKDLQVKGKISLIYFQLQDTHFVCLPSFKSYTFIADPSKLKKADLIAQAREQIEKLLRAERKENAINSNDLEEYYISKGEFVTTVEMNVQMEEASFSFEQTGMDWFNAFFAGSRDFDGGTELMQVGRNLNEFYPIDLKRAYYREELVNQLYNTIYHIENTPLVLVGPEGVGKRSIIDEVVYRYIEKQKELSRPAESYQRIWKVDPTRIIAGMSIVGMWQKRFEAILRHLRDRIKKYNPKLETSDKLLIDNPVALERIGKSSQNSMTLSDLLKPYLESRSLQVIILASPEEWKLMQEKDRRFADLFQVIRVPEPRPEDALRMNLELRKRLELDNDCIISVQAVSQLFDIHHNYFKRKALPGSVASLMTQLAVKFKHQKIDVESVQDEFKHYSGLNAQIFDDNYVFEENEVRKNIDAALIGQPKAVDSLTNIIHLIKARLQNPQKPLGSFLFIGPTGVGKTEAAKIITRYLLGNERKLMRFDMNEYIDAGAVSRLIGDYYNPEGQLTGKIRYNPFGILLFDEIEKAHPKVHDLLLQLLDDGRLTDSLGRTVDFVNTIIIMTSNVGASQAAQQLGFDTLGRNDEAIYRKAVENFFRPEFVNRIDQIVIFNGLGLEHILEIAQLQIKQLLSRDGFVRRSTILNISNDALEWVARRGYNEKMGGRALKRQIERDLTAFTAEQLIKTSTDIPIIFDIQLKDGRLYPMVEALEFVEPIQDNWLPEVPNDKALKRFYGQLLTKTEQLEKLLSEDYDDYNDYYEEDEEEDEGYLVATDEENDWLFYQFKNQIADKKEHFRLVLLGFKSKYEEKLSQNVFRLKSAGTSSIIYKSSETHKIEKILRKDILFQQSALDELRYVYQNAPEQFGRGQSAYMEDFVDMAYFNIGTQAAIEDQVDQIEIHIESMIENQGQNEMAYLRMLYTNLLEDMDCTFKLKDNNIIEAEGYAIYSWLKNESGYHLFYRSHQSTLPIRLTVLEKGSSRKYLNGGLKVLRLYDIWLGEMHRGSTITDLRTGYTNQADITVGEFKLLIYAALDAADRLKLK
jgi:ATP-dependent Clp protease ATP-binding subunit ClpC